VRAEISQLPLRLAWAITIHKSQGMSLDAAQIDLSRAFTPGMGYVALSRVRSVAGLYLQGVNNMALGMHPEIYAFDAQLRQASEELAAVTTDIVVESAAAAASATLVDEALFAKLKQWRYERAQADRVAPFIVAHNTHLSAIAAQPPANLNELLALHGFGKNKVEKYGPDILAIVVAHQAAAK
jgi:superfamily II DNA helicase RecQ